MHHAAEVPQDVRGHTCQEEKHMNARSVVQILMLSPIYPRLTLLERYRLVREFSQNYQLPERTMKTPEKQAAN